MSLFPKEVKIKVNNTLTLECEAWAIPTPTLVWYKDGQVKNMYSISKKHAFFFTLMGISSIYMAILSKSTVFQMRH